MPIRRQPTDPFQDSPQVPSPFDRQRKLAQAAASAAAAKREEQLKKQQVQQRAQVQQQSQTQMEVHPQVVAADQASVPESTDEQPQVRSMEAGSDPVQVNGSDTVSMQQEQPASTPQLSSRVPLKSLSNGSSASLVSFMQRNLKYIASVVGTVVVFALAVVIFAPLLSGQTSDEWAEQHYVSPYDWSKLTRADNRFAYVVDGQEKSRLGIDVSENQHEIDWDAVAADGIDFAMIRLGYRGATEGDLYLDDRFQENLAGAKNAGIDCGIYFFSQANTPEEAREEADFVLRYLQGMPLEYPIAFDTEESVVGITRSRTHGLDTAQMTAIAEAFCSRIEQAGYDTLVYGNRNDISRYKRSNMEARDLWWAEYGVPTPNAKIDFVMWQYSNAGVVDGIPTAVDMNIDLTHALD